MLRFRLGQKLRVSLQRWPDVPRITGSKGKSAPKGPRTQIIGYGLGLRV